MARAESARPAPRESNTAPRWPATRWGRWRAATRDERDSAEQNVCPPRRGSDRIPDGGADEPWSVQVADDQHQHVDRPDAQRAARVEVAEVVRLVAGFKQDRRDQKSGENEEEIDAGPSPERCVVEPCAGEARMAVVENDAQNCEAAQSLEFRDVGRQPGWALDWQEW